MKNIKKLMALALVIVSVLAVAAPALAATGKIDSTYGPTPGGKVNYYSASTSTITPDSGKKKGDISNGTTVTWLADVNPHWVKISYNGGSYFVLRQYYRMTGREWEVAYGTNELRFGYTFTNSTTYVKNLQRGLNTLGYNAGAVDGKFGRGTEDAVKAFQRANGLSVDGIAGPNTKKLLYRFLTW